MKGSRATCVALGESDQALLELREGAFGLARGLAAVQAAQRESEAEAGGGGQNEKQKRAGADDAAAENANRLMIRTRTTVVASAAEVRMAAPRRMRAEPEPPLQFLDIGVELFPRAHGSSLCVARYRLASRDSASAAPRTNSIRYHHRL